eukprot:SAG11_NODE_698_length_7682_cov_6.090993_1_plen_137_part_00
MHALEPGHFGPPQMARSAAAEASAQSLWGAVEQLATASAAAARAAAAFEQGPPKARTAMRTCINAPFRSPQIYTPLVMVAALKEAMAEREIVHKFQQTVPGLRPMRFAKHKVLALQNLLGPKTYSDDTFVRMIFGK